MIHLQISVINMSRFKYDRSRRFCSQWKFWKTFHRSECSYLIIVKNMFKKFVINWFAIIIRNVSQ